MAGPIPTGRLRRGLSRTPWRTASGRSYADLLDLFGLGQGIRLAAGALHRLVHLCLVAVQDGPEIERAVEQLVRRLTQHVAHLHLAHVVLHVLGVPAARVRDERKRREHEPRLRPEGGPAAPARPEACLPPRRERTGVLRSPLTTGWRP